MAKRKAGVNDIIFELDNDDIVISSDDEVKEAKKSRSSVETGEKTCENKNINEKKGDDVISIDSIEDSLTENKNRNDTSNGEKITSESTPIKNSPNEKSKSNDIEIIQSERIHCENNDNSCVNTITTDEDIVLDSPASNSGFAVIGCENRTPLISLRFKDSNFARVYKKTIKDFLVNLLKSSSEVCMTEIEESDNELYIWPEDLANESWSKDESTNIDDGLFFVDTEPCDDKYIEIPKYSQVSC